MSNNSLFGFAWHVPGNGFRWVDAPHPVRGKRRSHPVRVMVEQGESGLIDYWRYNPLLEAPALFQSLGDTLPTEEGIAQPLRTIGGPLKEFDVVTGKTLMAGRKAELFHHVGAGNFQTTDGPGTTDPPSEQVPR